MDRDGVEVHKNSKKERGQYPAISIEQAWSITDLLYGFRGNFSCGTRRVVPSGKDSSIPPAWVAIHSARIWFILHSHGASHNNNNNNNNNKRFRTFVGGYHSQKELDKCVEVLPLLPLPPSPEFILD